MECPDDATLATFMDGLCDAAERAAIADHLDGCDTCHGLVAELAKKRWRADSTRTARSRDVATDPAVNLSLPQVGDRLGRYTVLEPLGMGGMGVVFAAHDSALDRRVAIKLLRPALDADAREQRGRLRAEAQALAQLSHPHVVEVFEVGRWDEHDCVVMEYVEGRTLKEWHTGPRSWRECVHMYLQAGRGLMAAHERGLVHRDFKPGNCIVDDKGRVRVLDFGLVRALPGPTVELVSDSDPRPDPDLDPDPDLAPELEPNFDSKRLLSDGWTRTGVIVGTVPYMPPEQLRGEAVDTRSDQWSLCAALFEAVYGHRPFYGGKTVRERLRIVSQTTLRRPRTPEAPRRLFAVLKRGLAARPDDRWPSIEALLVALESVESPRRRSWSVAAAGLAALVLGALVLWPTTPDACEVASQRLTTLWDEDAQARVEHAMHSVDTPWADGIWRRVVPRLDDYAERLIQAQADACIDARDAGDASAEHQAARLDCLGEPRRQLRAVVELLSQADAGVVERAVRMVDRLPSLSRCVDTDAPAHWTAAPPPTPLQAKAIERLQERLAQARISRLAGRYAMALAAAQNVLAQAEAMGYEPLIARAAYLIGRSQQDLGRYPEAVASLERAFFGSGPGHPSELRAKAAIVLVLAVTEGEGRYDDAQIWARHAEAHLDRTRDIELAARLDNNLAAIALRRGRLSEAIASFERAADGFRRALGPSHRDVAAALYNQAGARLELGQLDRARDLIEQALTIERQVLGPTHPDVVKSLQTLAGIHDGLGNYSRSDALLEQVLDMRRGSLGPEHPDVASTLYNMALSYKRQGRLEEAAEPLEQALSIQERALGPEHPAVAEVLDELGDLELSRDRVASAERMLTRALSIKQAALDPRHPSVASTLEYIASVELHRDQPARARDRRLEALEIQRDAYGRVHPIVAGSLNNLALVYEQLDEPAQALTTYREAAEIYQQVLPEGHPLVAFVLTGMGNAYLDLGQPRAAVRPLMQALDIRERTEASPNLRGHTRFSLAKAVYAIDTVEDEPGPDLGCGLARIARREYASVDRTETVAEIDQWLERCQTTI